jgi:hypothetical protein
MTEGQAIFVNGALRFESKKVEYEAGRTRAWVGID